jgi:RimJ/RimL family protein N-acetyltransferase
MTNDAAGQCNRGDMAVPVEGRPHRVILRGWADCSSSIQGAVFDWADHPEVPAHAGRGMVVASIIRELDTTMEDRLHRAVHDWIVFDGDRAVAFLAAEIRPKWIVPEEFWPSEFYEVSVPGTTMSFSTLVDPAVWGRNYSAAAKTVAIEHPAAALVETFRCEIRADNQRSLKAMAKVPAAQMIGTTAEQGHPWRHFRWPRHERRRFGTGMTATPEENQS